MSRLSHILIVMAAAVIAFGEGCTKSQPNHCPNAPFNNCLNVDAGPKPCTSSNDCEEPTAVCDVNDTKVCVQCVDPDDTSACSGTSPVCGPDKTCQPCSAHAQCDSNACLPTGACGDDDSVAYVAPPSAGGADNAMCRAMMPCATVAAALATSKPYIKFQGTIDEGVVIDSQNVTLLAEPGAKLTRTVNGLILNIVGASQVEIYDLEISGGSSAQGIGIVIQAGSSASLTLTRALITNNAGGGIVASGGSLRVTQSTISANQAGGISVDGAGTTFDITNTFIFRNGDNSSSTFGGLDLDIAVAGTNRLAFNTIVDNEASNNSGGVVCNVATFSAPNNIIARNQLGGSPTAPNAQFSGACTYPTSKIQNDVNGLAFEDPDVPAPFVYRLTAASTAVDQATTIVPMIDTDNEGDRRPQGPQNDIGADELRK